nr:hypothetical protein [Tanacetum cinerariifolium]
MCDEYFNPPTIAVSLVPVAAEPRTVDIADSPVSTLIDLDAPSKSIPSTQEHKYSPIISQGFKESPKTPHYHDDLLLVSHHEDSTSQGSSSNVRPSHTPFKHLGRWTKDHPTANMIVDPTLFIQSAYVLGIRYSKDIDMSLTAYSDADQAECQDTKRSTSGSAQFIGNKLVSWSSKKQKSIAILSTQIPLYCNNKSVIALCCNNVHHSRAKHINVHYHFIKDQSILSRNMNPVTSKQVALDNYLVPPKKRLKIEKCNARIEFSKPQTEETYQVTLDALKLSPFYPAFLITAKYGALIPNEMINQYIKDSKAYKIYLDFAIRKDTPKKARKFKKGDGVGSQPKVLDEQKDKTTSTDEGTGTKPGDPDDDDNDDVDSNVGGNKEASDSEKTDSDGDENPNLNQNDDKEEEYEDELKETEHEEERKGDEKMTNVGRNDGTQQTTYDKVKDDEHVILTTVLDTQKTKVPLQSSSVSSKFASQFLNVDNVSPANNEVFSMMTLKVRHKEPSTQTPALLNIPVTVIPKTLTVTESTIPPIIPPITHVPQQSIPTPTPTPTTATTTTLIPAPPHFL